MQRTGGVILLGSAIAFTGAAWLVRDHRRTPYDADFEAVGNARVVDSDLLRAFAKVESGMNPNAVGPLNANQTRDYGLMQINDATAHGYGVNAASLVGAPRASIDLAARILLDMRRQLGEHYSLQALISSYNQGAARTIASGIVNAVYVQSVMFHHQLYSLGRLFR